jgi:hypothetical protein
MGLYFTDQFSLLHFAVGIVVYYWNMSFILWFIVHMIFEYVENTKYGMSIINNFVYWPGGKDHADSLINNLGDQFYALIGWGSAYIVCNM